MRFFRPNGGIVELGDGALDTLHQHRQINSESTEAGGVLLGRIIIQTEDIVIDAASSPDRSDVRRRFFFFRRRRHAQIFVTRSWVMSKATQNYLGEWHTHPEADPVPSCVDLRSWRRTAKKTVCDQRFLLFVIVGTSHLRVWEIDSDCLRIIALEPIP